MNDSDQNYSRLCFVVEYEHKRNDYPCSLIISPYATWDYYSKAVNDNEKHK